MLYSLLHPLYNLLHSTALERKTARSALRERHMAVGVGQGSDWGKLSSKLDKQEPSAGGVVPGLSERENYRSVAPAAAIGGRCCNSGL